MTIIVYGAKGRMGSLLIQYLRNLNVSFIAIDSDDIHATLITQTVDVIIDFSHPNAVTSLIDLALEKKIPLVIGTTGHNQKQQEQIVNASQHIPIFKSANFSIGIYIMCQLIKEAYPLMDKFYDIDIIDKHHRYKVDTPSGTALLLAKTIQEAANESLQIMTNEDLQNGPRKAKSIGMQSLRSGQIVGEHEVIFSGEYDQIEITHKAQSKTVFVEGAYQAANYIVKQKPGVYTMEDLMKERGI